MCCVASWTPAAIRVGPRCVPYGIKIGNNSVPLWRCIWQNGVPLWYCIWQKRRTAVALHVVHRIADCYNTSGDVKEAR